MSKLSERQRLVITIAVSVVLTGVLLFLVFSDRSEINTIEDEISALNVRIQAAEVERRKIPAREDKVLVFRAVEPRELAVLPTEQRIADFHRNLSTFLSAADMRFQELPESSPEDSELAKGIRVTRNKVKGRGDAKAVLKFVNLIENDPRLVAVKGFKVQAGDVNRDAPLDPIEHDFEVELETYFYRPSKGGIKREHIPGAEERLQDPKLKEAILSFQPERPDSYVLRPATDRRDPFVDPRRVREKVDPEEREKQWKREEALVIDYETRYREIAEDIQKETQLGLDGDYFRQDRLRRKINDRINVLRTLLEESAHKKSVQLPELASRVAIVTESLGKTRASRPEQEMTITRAVCEKQLKEMRRLFESDDYATMQASSADWNSFIRDRRTTPEAKVIIDEIRELLTRAKILGEFQAKPYHITGLIEHTDPARSVALINGTYVRQGDRLSEDGEVRVHHIDSDKVSFQYKGLVIIRVMGENDGGGDADAPKKQPRKKARAKPRKKPS